MFELIVEIYCVAACFYFCHQVFFNDKGKNVDK